MKGFLIGVGIVVVGTVGYILLTKRDEGGEEIEIPEEEDLDRMLADN